MYDFSSSSVFQAVDQNNFHTDETVYFPTKYIYLSGRLYANESVVEDSSILERTFTVFLISSDGVFRSIVIFPQLFNLFWIVLKNVFCAGMKHLMLRCDQ